MYLQIPYNVARQIADHAQDHAPNEVCGLLAGAERLITIAIPISNIAENPTSQFQMNPNEQVKALKLLDSKGLEWIGVYHSHPESAPIPSQTDIQDVVNTKHVHLIVSLNENKPKLKAWRIKHDKVLPIDLIFDTQAIPYDAHTPLSNSQKTAIIVASILCVILMLAISFSLLPPAPEITPIP